MGAPLTLITLMYGSVVFLIENRVLLYTRVYPTWENMVLVLFLNKSGTDTINNSSHRFSLVRLG